MTLDSVRCLAVSVLAATATFIGGLIGWWFGEPVIGAVALALLLGTVIWLAWRSDRQRMDAGRSHERLVGQERLFREMVESAPQGIIILDASGQVRLANQTAATMFGYARPDDLLALETIEAQLDTDTRARMAQFRQTGTTAAPHDFRVCRPDGTEIWCQADMRPTSWEGRSAVVAFLIDATEQKRAEAALADARDAAKAANRAKNEFLANVSHEIRTPMNAVVGLSHLALASCRDPALGETLTKIVGSTKALLGVIDDILEFSKIEDGDLEIKHLDFSLSELTDSLQVMLGTAAEQRGLELVVQQSPNLPKVMTGDPHRLSQVLRNIIANSIKFSEHGRILVTIDEIERSEARIALRFSVRDWGIGMSLEQQDKLFQAFSQGDGSMKRRHGGIGLGLIICKRLVEAMGGSIVVDSTVGQGSIFSFTLGFELRSHPARRSRDVGAGKPSEKPIPRLAGVRVLIVEDNPLNQAIAQGIMTSAGAIASIAANGLEAVNRLQASMFDVVLMDLQMPEMDGYAATRAIRIDLGLTWLPIIAVTAHALEEEKRRCREIGMNEHLSKPVEPELLISTVHAMVEAQTLPGIDMRDAMRRLGRDRTLLERVYRDFCDRYHSAADELAGLIATGRPEDAVALGHILEGMAGNLGAQRVSAAARALLVKLKTGEYGAELIDELRVALAELSGTPPSGRIVAAPDGADQTVPTKPA